MTGPWTDNDHLTPHQVAEARGGRTHSIPQTIDTKAYHEVIELTESTESRDSVTNCDNLWTRCPTGAKCLQTADECRMEVWG